VPYLPALQFSQVESPYELYLPAGQSLQCVAPSSLIKLATPVPSLSLLELVVKCPALQVLHDDPPVFVRYFPDSQAVQSSGSGPATEFAPVLVEYRPAAHGPLQELDVAPAAPYLPALQFSQVASPFELNLPAGQALQCVAPVATPMP